MYIHVSVRDLCGGVLLEEVAVVWRCSSVEV